MESTNLAWMLGVTCSCVVLAVACGGKATRTGAIATGGAVIVPDQDASAGASTGGTAGDGFGGGSGGRPQDRLTDCASWHFVDPTAPLIADFECLPGPAGQKFDWFPSPDSWQGSWQHGAYWSYQSASQFDASQQAWTCVPTARGGLIEPGHASTTAGYVEALVPQSDRGAVFGIWFDGSGTVPPTDLTASCVDASALSGFSFWIKGENTGSLRANAYRVELQTFDTLTAYPAEPRTCAYQNGTEVCTGTKAGGCVTRACKPYFYDGTLPAEWTKVTVWWSDFAQDSASTVTAPLSPQRLTGIAFVFDTQARGGTVRVLIDDIEFASGAAVSELPRTCPSPAGGAAGAAPDYSTWQTAGAGGSLAGLPVCDGTPAGGIAGL